MINKFAITKVRTIYAKGVKDLTSESGVEYCAVEIKTSNLLRLRMIIKNNYLNK
jgi:hypothetical protein